MKKRIIIIISVGILLVVVFAGLYVEHYYGDNIYAAFAFRDSNVIKVDDNTFRAPKDDYQKFTEYMLGEGWRMKDRLGSMLIFENDEQTAECSEEFKEFYAEYNVTYYEKEKIVPSSPLIDIYGKCLYHSFYKNGRVNYTSGEESLDNKSTWTVAWYQDEKTPKMKSATLTVETGKGIVLKEELELQKAKGENGIHGWNYYVLAPTSFSADCKEPDTASAYIVFIDSNGVEYKVCLDPTEINETDPNTNTADNSNEIIITDKNDTYSYWDYKTAKEQGA